MARVPPNPRRAGPTRAGRVAQSLGSADPRLRRNPQAEQNPDIQFGEGLEIVDGRVQVSRALLARIEALEAGGS